MYVWKYINTSVKCVLFHEGITLQCFFMKIMYPNYAFPVAKVPVTKKDCLKNIICCVSIKAS